MRHCPWLLQETTAELRAGSLRGAIDIAHPEQGFHSLSFSDERFPGEWLCVQQAEDSSRGQPIRSWPLAVADAYVRGVDLVASYQPSQDWPYSPQIYWSASREDRCEGTLSKLSLLISVETHLLDTWPRIRVESVLPCSEVLQVRIDASNPQVVTPLEGSALVRPTGGACCILRRFPNWPFSYAELMPSSDFHEVRLARTSDNECRVEWLVFGEFLEKGVIRRARIEALFLPRGDDVRLAAACCQAIDERPLPLTT